MSRFTKIITFLSAGVCLTLVLASRSFSAGLPVKAEGVIKHDTLWSGSVIVDGDVLVPEGVTLTISPGATVMFMPGESTKIEPMFLSMQTELLVRGILKASGTNEAPIRFGAAPEALAGNKPERGDWGGVIFDGQAASASVMSHAEISKADAAVSAYRSSPSVADCIIEDCRYGVVCMGGGRPDLAGTSITGCEYGVVAGEGGKPLLEGATVSKNAHDLLLRD